ncbi:MAG: tRNA-wybutosine modification methyltransferase TYW3 [Thermoplasmatota archaeon]
MVCLKEATIEKLSRARSEGLVDPEVVPLLDAINRLPGAVTTSSCSGRFQLIQVPDLGDKQGSNILGKWHRKVTSGEVIEAYSTWDGSGQVHLLVQPLLVHVRCRDVATTAMIRNLAQEGGLKFSTVRSLKLGNDGQVVEWGAVVEMMGTERMEVPIHCIDGEVVAKILPALIDHGNGLMDRTRSNIDRMVRLFSELFPVNSTVHK